MAFYKGSRRIAFLEWKREEAIELFLLNHGVYQNGESLYSFEKFKNIMFRINNLLYELNDEDN